ncbi:MAG: ABC transporter substrate-binding protein [Clostridia bacterium]|nr:ABC transporter substrate-binding protein [Clostridia bacterium]
MKKLLSLVLTLALLLTAFATVHAEDEKSVNIGVTSTIATLNPLAMDATEIVKYATSLVFQSLVEADSELNFVPVIAESITTEDNLNFTIKVKEDAVWSDGTPITAQDVEFTLIVAADPQCANISLAMYSIVGVSDNGVIEQNAASIEGIRVVDDKTLTVATKYPTALSTFTNNFGRYALILPRHILQDVPRAELLTYEWFNHPDVISGPYFINDFDLQHYVHYVANENYFLGAPKIKYLNINVVAPSQLLAGLQSGEIDLIQQTMGAIPVEDYDAVKALPNVSAVDSTPITNELVFVNVAKVTDERIRQALLYGMDRQAMLENLLGDSGTLVDGFLVPASPYFSQELGVTAYDPDKAAQLIAEAKADGASTDLTWYVSSEESVWGNAVQYFAAMFEEMGLNITIRTVDLANLMTVVSEGGHDILSVEYTMMPADPYTDVAWLIGGQSLWTGYTSPATDEALALSQSLTDEKEIAAQYLVVNRAMQQDAPVISGWVIAKLGAVNNRIVNAHPDVYGTFLNVQDWDVQ